jgi:hypothetical protein
MRDAPNVGLRRQTARSSAGLLLQFVHPYQCSSNIDKLLMAEEDLSSGRLSRKSAKDRGRNTTRLGLMMAP